MNINRDNYEEFFLLGIDNELSVADKKMLDEFLIQNPDLLEEFTMLQQSVLKPDSVIFDNKSSLIKELNLSDKSQESLLLLLDNELKGKEKKAAEKLITNNAAAKEEWSILLQTKLTADETVVFDDKHLLYKKEEGGRVIAFRWWKVAVAAIFIGFGIWGGISFLIKGNNPRDNNEIARNKPSGPATDKKDNGVVKDQTISMPLPPAALADESSVAAAQEKKSIQTTAGKVEQENLPVKKEKLVPDENDAIAKEQKTAKKPSNNLPKPYFENLNNTESNNDKLASVPQEKQDNKFTDNSSNDFTETKTVNGNKYATTAVFTENNEDNNPESFDDGDENKSRKTKLGGFLKKAKRMLERKTKMKTGDDNFKVANLSFAIQ